MPSARAGLLVTLTAAIVFGIVEAGSFAAMSILKGTGTVYDSGAITQSYSDYLEKRDAELGWGPRSNEANVAIPEYAAPDGTRKDPSFGTDDTPCVSIFGDSFTWSTEVADADAWGAVLAKKLGCRVGNYGVGGYGSDQSFLRYLSLPPKGNIVFLNHLSENILRNVNQFRPLLYPGTEFAFKPRFVLSNGELRKIPTPEIPPEHISDFLQHPAAYLDHEFFLPGGESGVRNFAFPYSAGLIAAVVGNFHIRATIRGEPRHMQFYDPGHSSGGLPVTFSILQAFTKAAAARGQTAIVTLIPTCRDLRFFYATGVSPYKPLKELLVAQHVRFIDFADEIAIRTQKSDPERLYGTCSSHFNKNGYRLLAEIAADYLKEEEVLRSRLGPKASFGE
jgi:lysophospholipase L1-like esterase